MTGRPRPWWRSPYVAIACAVLFAAGAVVVGSTVASFSAETDNNTSTFAGGWIGTASGLTATPSGYDAQLAWTPGTHGPVTGQTLNYLDNGASSTCPGSGYSTTAMASASTASYTQSQSNPFTTLGANISNTATSLTVASSAGFPVTPFTIQIDEEQLTVNNVSGTTWTVVRGANSTTNVAHTSGAGVVRVTDTYNGHYLCYQMVSTSASNWTGTASFPGLQLGLVATAMTVTQSTAGRFSTNDTIKITFNQKPVLTALTNVRLCEVWPAGTAPVAMTVFLEYSSCALTNGIYQVKLTGLTHGTTGSVTAGNSNVALTGAPSVSASAPWIVTWTVNGNTTAASVNAGTATAIPDGSQVKSVATTDQAPACISATYNCQPTGSVR